MAIPVSFAEISEDDVAQGEFELMPSGTYDAVVFDYEIRESGPSSKNPGSQYVSWTFNITTEGYDTRKQWSVTSLADTAGAKKGLFYFLRAVGQEPTPGQQFDLDLDSIVGTPVKLVIGEDEYQGKKKNIVRFVNAASGTKADTDLPG